MKRVTKEVNGELIKWVIPTILLLVFLLITLVSYGYTMHEKAQEKVLDRIGEEAILVAGYYNGFYEAITETIEAFADDCVDSREDLFDSRQLAMLDKLVRDLGLKKGYIVRTDLTAIDNSGKLYDEFSKDQNLIGLIDAKEGNVSVVDEAGEVVKYISYPIRTETEWYGNVIFVFHPNKMHELINESTPFFYIFTFSSGMVAETYGAHNALVDLGDNIYENSKEYEYIYSSASEVQQAIQAHRSGRYVAKDSNGIIHFISYYPVGDYGAYSMVCALEDQVNASIKEENKPTRVLIIKIIISMVVFITLLIVIYFITKINLIRSNKDLKDKAETDLLTGLNNKISTELKIAEYLENEGADKVNMFCVLDIDNFKKINDTMGHAFGDEVLSSIGKGLLAEFRISDIVGRAGGDEFIMLLKDLKSDEIINREAERIERFFNNLQVGSYTKYSPTASIGVAIFPRDGKDYGSLYKAADSALYVAKEKGKNQLAFYNKEEKA